MRRKDERRLERNPEPEADEDLVGGPIAANLEARRRVMRAQDEDVGHESQDEVPVGLDLDTSDESLGEANEGDTATR